MGSHATIDITELTIPTFHTLLREGQTTITAIVSTYLTRIAQHDATIKSLITINPHALAEANAKDEETIHLLKTQTQLHEDGTSESSGNLNLNIKLELELPTLHGVPIILKDNYTTKDRDLPTSAGSKALASLTTTKDSEVVAHLRTAGAIILAKANLHEFALHGTTTSSLGGQTLNPYDLSRTPGGSSGGTAAALALNLGLVGCGTDTVNSLRSPASACSIVGFRPSLGRVSTVGIIPVSETQDTAGPMGRCVGDVRIMFDVMSGASTAGRYSELGCPVPPSRSIPDRHSERRDLRIGILEEYFELEDTVNLNAPDADSETLAENAIVQDIIRKAISKLSSSSSSSESSTNPSATGTSSFKLNFVSIKPTDHADNDWSISNLLQNADTQAFEFQECINKFLTSSSESSISQTPHKSLKSIAQSNQYHEKAITEVFKCPLADPDTYCRTSEAYQARKICIANLKSSVRALFESQELDALIYPHQRHFPVKVGVTVQPARNGILAALTGRPAVCFPAGFGPVTATAAQGIPIGIELMGREGHDEEVLDIAEWMEGVLKGRKMSSLEEVRPLV